MHLCRLRARRWTSAAVVVGLVVAVGAGCASTTSAPTTAAGASRVVPVVAAEDLWGSLAAQLGGSHVEVRSTIANPASDPHDYEPTAADARHYAQARYVIENGLGYDTWAAHLLAANRTAGQRVLDVGHLLGLRAGDNPHRWYFPGDVARVVDRITADLQALDPADAAYFARRQRTVVDQALRPYRQAIARVRSTYAGTPVAATESIFVGLAQATGLRLVTPERFLDAISEGTEPTTADTDAVRRELTHHQVAVLVFNRQNATPDVQALVDRAQAAHIPVVRITETLAPQGTTFQAWQTGQLRALDVALARAEGAHR